MQSPSDIRKDYLKRELIEEEAAADPFVQFERWWEDLISSGAEEPNAMTLATADANGLPAARIVLLKGFHAGRFDFYTNYDSRKGKDLAENPRAALLFFWPGLERQVRVEGTVIKLSATESDAYFASRPLKSRLGAWASDQSREIESRKVLETNYRLMEERFNDNVPRPPHWGGYSVEPARIEFWQGRASRLHDRLLYEFENGSWRRHRLAP